ncbi:MAG: hypothetical protein OEU92_01805 [Alphaproteobacteria bacterium]|nr:hypothetical protein [Alphaproteobacteria bacterium]
MSEPSIETLKRDVQEAFGVALTDEQAEACRGRLPTMLENVHLLADWAGRLGDTAPAQIQRAIEAPSPGARSDD